MKVDFLKSLLFNLKVFPLKDALKFHILVYRDTNIKLMGVKINTSLNNIEYISAKIIAIYILGKDYIQISLLEVQLSLRVMQ